MLPRLPGIGERKVRMPRPVIPEFATDPQTSPEFNIQPYSTLQDAARSRFPRVRPSAKDEILVLAEMAETAAQAHPGRNRGLWKQIYACTGSNKNCLIVDRYNPQAGVQVFIQIEHRRHFQRNTVYCRSQHVAGVPDFEASTLARAHERVKVSRSLDSLVADDGHPVKTEHFILLILSNRRRRQNRHHCQDCAC